MPRAFLAVLLDDALKGSLRVVQDSVKQRLAAHLDRSVRVQWVRPEALHVTLKFLGAIEDGQVELIKERIRPAVQEVHAMAVVLTHLGVFPDVRAPRVLWVGCRSSSEVAALADLANAVDRALTSLGFEPDGRPFQPHLTLARIKDGARSFGQALLRSGLLDRDAPIGTCQVGHLHLMQSDLRPSGPVYSPLWSLALRPNETPP